MNRYKILLILTMISSKSYSQDNLVPNPSFEQYDTCPDNAGQIEYAIPWTIPLKTNTPDFFNSCNTGNFSVPSNFAGYEFARTGEAYAEIGTDVFNPINPLSDSHREYIQIELLRKLVAGTSYCIKFYVSACDSANYISDNIGIYFSQNEIHDTVTPYESPLPYVPQFENSAHLDKRHGWTEVLGKFNALGDERFIVIGNFRDHNSTNSTYTGWSVGNIHFVAQYYIDDISICQCDSDSIIMPNVFTPNGDQINDLFIPREKHNIRLGMLKIFNRWGMEVFETNNIYDGWDGDNCSEGVYYWELFYDDILHSNHRRNGYVILIR
jgi:OOP family OmpA-OmpF porin